jgi:hypothetical protein
MQTALPGNRQEAAQLAPVAGLLHVCKINLR